MAIEASVGGAYAQEFPLEPRQFREIDVRGNERFRDGDVIVSSGLDINEPLGEADMIAALEALDYTGEFDDIVITSEGDLLVITVDETPEYTGGITFGLGYDSDDGVFGAVSLDLDDVFGETSKIRSDLLLSEPKQTFDLRFSSDNFWAQGVRGGVRLDFANFQYDNVTYNYRRARLEPYVRFVLGRVGTAELRYTFGSDDIYNVDDDASPIIHSEEGQMTSSGVGFSFMTGSAQFDGDRLGIDGWALRFDQDFTGLGGDTDLSTTRLKLAGRKSLFGSGFALRSEVEMGSVQGLGDEEPRASERFALGGARLRGFERGTIAPRDICEGCGSDGDDIETILGGEYYAVARNDFLVPIFSKYPEVETFAFFDIGSAWQVSNDTPPAGDLDDSRSWRSSYGIGAGFDTAIGRFETYYAIDTDGEEFDEDQQFGLTFRSTF